MIDFVQLQEDVTWALLSADSLDRVNIVQERKLRLEQQPNEPPQGVLQMAAFWLLPRNGHSGCGVAVEMPSIFTPHPNLPGPEFQLVITCAVVEEPNLNFTPNQGTGQSAEEVAQLVLEILHGLHLEGLGDLFAKGVAIETAKDFQNLLAYRVRLTMLNLRPQTARVPNPIITELAGLITLANATAYLPAAIYYTLDGTFPGRGNPAAQLYSAPFYASVGQVIRWAAFQPGLLSSYVSQATLT